MNIKRFFQQAYFYHKGRTAAFNAEEFWLLQIGYPLVTLCFYCLLASYSFKTTDLSYWVVGNAFLLCTNSCTFSLGTIFIGERYNGRLRSIIASPCNKLALIAANGVSPAIIAIISSAVGIIIGSLVFHVDFSGINIAAIFVAIVIAMFAASAFGIFIAVLGLITDNIHLVLNLISLLMMILTGAEFPIENLPGAVRFISWILPLTKPIKAIDSLFAGNTSLYLPLVLGEIATGTAFLFAARILFAWAERRARIAGTLDLY